MSLYRKVALKVRPTTIIFLLILTGCSGPDTSETTYEEVVKAISFTLPRYNGECIYSEKEAISDLERLRAEPANFSLKPFPKALIAFGISNKSITLLSERNIVILSPLNCIFV